MAGKHRFSEKERAAVWDKLTPYERSEYNTMAFGYDLFGAQANLERMRELENRGFARLQEEN